MHRLSYLLVRVDDRLLHGQVALGWRQALDPAGFLIVDDAIAGDPFSLSLFEAALPEGTTLEVLDTAGFVAGRARANPERTVLLVRGLDGMARLVDGGFRPESINLGGLHERAGARRYLDYLFLTADDLRAAESLAAAGIRLYAQDLPSRPPRPFAELLAQGGAKP
ncbi:MAG: PTS system mannose/fructose/N-acetylgalactosamine-transporter subunit IIB [Candidatus Eisenbacteria bacterium]|nr:PTS sugar transporter subunit IIB [Candidatus Eisenbacteria bacterium]